jgi:hypothetical protein
VTGLDLSRYTIGLVLGVVLVAATPCRPASPPTGTWTYTRSIGRPQPSASIKREGRAIVVHNFAADRAFTSTTSRYDAESLDLVSVVQHASCCAGEWSATVTQSADGSYDVVTKRFTQPGNGKLKETLGHVRLPRTDRPLIVNSIALLPWIYHATHARSVESVSLPDLAIDSVRTQTLGIAEVAGEARPSGLPAGERALRVTRESGDATVLWYDPCTFVVDAFKIGTSIVVRSELIK